ncbi:MAG: putative maturation protein [Dirlevirus faecenecus]|uniref:Maturation protein n=1 Tax=Leviviridae sp. TaxID=2027243 RepID=A0ABY3SVK8_9VIRU|nr:MAG: putative maturation protein [Leviviridae sp.]
MITLRHTLPSVAQHWRQLLEPWENNGKPYDFENGSFRSRDMSGTRFREVQNSRMWNTFSARQTVVHHLGVQAGYSSFVSNDGGTEPAPVSIKYNDRAPPNPNPGWRKRKTTLAMIVSDYYNWKVTVVCKPNKVDKQQTYKSEVYSPAKYWTGLFSFQAGNRLYVQFEGKYYFLLESDAYMYGPVYQFRTTWGSTPTPPLSIKEFMSKLEASREVDVGIVTETVASANSNSVDILTAAAEMPETIKETLLAMRSVVTIVSDVKKRRLSVTKSYEAKKQHLERIHSLRLAKIEAEIRKPDIKRRAKIKLQKRLENSLKLRQRDFDKAASEFGTALAGVWMWFRYSLSPNLYLIDDALDALNALHSVFDTHREKDEQEIVFHHLSQSWSVTNDLRRLHRCMLKRQYVLDSVAPRNIGQVMSANLATTAWELVSRSFVIDWFVNIGDFLTAIMPTDLDYLNQVATYSYKDRGTVTFTNTVGGVVEYHVEAYERNVLNPSDFIGLTFEPALNLFRSFDAVAMLWPSVRNEMLRKK